MESKRHGAPQQTAKPAVVKAKKKAATPPLTLDQIAFRAADVNATMVSKALVYDKLFAINDANPDLIWKDPAKKQVIKVVTMMKQGTYDKYFKGKTKGVSDPNFPNWVTAAPQLRQFCQATGLSGPPVVSRLMEWLGLKPGAPYAIALELWVDRANLLRPCPDPEIDDAQCNIAFEMKDGLPVNPVVNGFPVKPATKGLGSYLEFFNGVYKGRYDDDPYPWTRLGYTYDWNPATPIYGASEYVITPGKPFDIAGAIPLVEYCKR